MSATARWHRHANAVRPPDWMRNWLTDDGSLTAKLMASGTVFRVRRLRQGSGRCLADECRAIGLQRRIQVRERDVLLLVDDEPVVFAHTVMPLKASAGDWPFFSALGDRSLGSTLFADPLVRRNPLHYAHLAPDHPLVRRAIAAGIAGYPVARLFARRSLFRRRHGLMLVTEVFLPALGGIGKPASGPKRPYDNEQQ